MPATSGEDAALTFDPLHPRLIRIAYRMLGSVADAIAAPSLNRKPICAESSPVSASTS
jgi:hypothetical protein